MYNIPTERRKVFLLLASNIAINEMLNEHIPIKASESEARLMQACEQTLQEEVFYTEEFKARVSELMNDIKPEGGFDESFDMDVYYMRKIIEERLKLRANRLALNALMGKYGWTIGKEWKGKFEFGGKYSKLILQEMDKNTGEVKFLAIRRGSPKRWIVTTGANSTRMLAQLFDTVQDETIKELDSEVDGMSSFKIDFTANRGKEFTCQI